MNLNLLPEEQKILELKYQGKRIGLMGEEESLIAANAILLKIHAITGWNFPDPMFAKVLKEQFVKKMKEGFASVNMEEVEYAFRTYGAEVKDWGKSMNLNLIDEVLRPYLQTRHEVSKIEESQQKAALPPPPQDRDKTMDEWMEETRKGVNEGTVEWNFLPITLYDYMIQKELFLPSKEYKHEILKQAVEKRQAMIEPATPQMSAFLRMKENKVFQEEEAAIIRGMCKKLTLFDYLWNNEI